MLSLSYGMYFYQPLYKVFKILYIVHYKEISCDYISNWTFGKCCHAKNTTGLSANVVTQKYNCMDFRQMLSRKNTTRLLANVTQKYNWTFGKCCLAKIQLDFRQILSRKNTTGLSANVVTQKYNWTFGKCHAKIPTLK